MKRLFFIILMLLPVAVSADEKSKLSFAYDVDFEMLFDNREIRRSYFTPSMTIFGARLTPQVGLSIGEQNGARHRVMAGIDVMKDFGSGKDLDLFRELTLYYNFSKTVSKTEMEIYAGIFPRSTMEGSWSQAFFSDSLRFYDNNLEGLLLKFRRPKAYFEVGCDWMGQYGQDRREKFMVFTSGEGRILPFMSLGYAGYMLHYANSVKAKGLVDNILINPYVRFDLSEKVGMQILSFRLGYLQAMQRDRKYVGAFVCPYGGEFDQEVRNWNVGISNRMFYGFDMMPYYNMTDNVGQKYAADLYFGDPFYRVRDDGSADSGFYDRLEFYYEPTIGNYLKIRVSAFFHFNGSRYSGCQQMVSLLFNLNSLTSSFAKRSE